MANQPARSNDADGQCLHLYLTRDATCVHCGIKFGLAWQASRQWLTRPSVRNIVSALGGAAGMILVSLAGGGVFFTVFLVITVLFVTRTILGGIEMYVRHGFVPGTLGPLSRRTGFNILAPKSFWAYVGRVKFPMDEAIHGQFREGDTLLVEYLRWSRLPVAIYLGTYPR